MHADGVLETGPPCKEFLMIYFTQCNMSDLNSTRSGSQILQHRISDGELSHCGIT